MAEDDRRAPRPERFRWQPGEVRTVDLGEAADVRGTLPGGARFSIDTGGWSEAPAEAADTAEAAERINRALERDTEWHSQHSRGPEWAAGVLRRNLPGVEITYVGDGPKPPELPETAIP